MHLTFTRGFFAIAVLLAQFLVALNCLATEATLTIVTDTWPPYVIQTNEEVSGADVDITRAIFKKLNLNIDIQVKPWKRCIALVKQKKADGILGVSLNEERTHFLNYPSNPISTGTTVFFKQAESEIQFTGLPDLNKQRVGAILGYSYCKELDKQAFILKAERVSALEQNFNKLLAGRLDLVVEVDSVGLYTAKRMGISDDVSILSGAHYCAGGNYLAFSKKPGHDELTKRFNQALSDFVHTPEYQAIMTNYGLLQ